MPSTKKIVAKPAAAKPAAAKKAAKGGALEIAPIAATGLLLAAQKMYKDMMAEEAKRPASAAKRTRKARRGGLGPNGEPDAEEPGADGPVMAASAADRVTSYSIPAEGDDEAAPAAEEQAAAVEDAPAAMEAAPAAVEGAQAAAAEQAAAAQAAAVKDAPAAEAASNPTLVEAAVTVIKNMNDKDKADLDNKLAKADLDNKLAMEGGAKKARKSSAKPRTKRGGSAGIFGAELPAMAGGSEKLSMPAPLAGGAKKKKRGGGEIAPVAAIAGGSEKLSMPAPLAGGAKKKTRGGGEIAPVAAMAGGSEKLSMPAPLAGGAKKTKKKSGGGEMLGSPIALAGGSEKLSMPAPLAMAGGAKKTKKSGGGALAPIAAVAGGMPMAPANTAPVYVERTSPMAGGAKKKAATKRMAGGELAAYTDQLSKLTSQLRTLM
jgi:hypothetical protein